MPDPTSDQPPDGPDFGGGPAGEYEAAQEKVRAVAAWYNEQILREHRAAVPDPERLEQLKAQRETAVADQKALRQAGPQEVARIAALYEARYRELTQ